MKILPKKMVWSASVMIAGIALFIVQMMKNGELNSTAGFAVGIIGTSVVKLIQFYRISINPLYLKKYEIAQKEERTIALAEKSGRFSFLVTIFIEFIAIFVLILLDKNAISTIVSYVAAAQALIYLLTYFYLNRKY